MHFRVREGVIGIQRELTAMVTLHPSLLSPKGGWVFPSILVELQHVNAIRQVRYTEVTS